MAKVGCTSCAKKAEVSRLPARRSAVGQRKTAVGKVTKRRKRARVGKTNYGAWVAGGILLVGIGGALYLKFSSLENKIVMDGVDINGISGGKINLTIHIVNLGSVSLPFSGYNGYLYLNQNIELGNVLIKETATIPAHGVVSLPVGVSPNWLSLPSIAKQLKSAIENKDWSNFRLDLNGTLFVGDISIPIDYRIS